jgi:hypothetical protein
VFARYGWRGGRGVGGSEIRCRTSQRPRTFSRALRRVRLIGCPTWPASGADPAPSTVVSRCFEHMTTAMGSAAIIMKCLRSRINAERRRRWGSWQSGLAVVPGALALLHREIGRSTSLVKGHPASTTHHAPPLRTTHAVRRFPAQAGLPFQGSGCQASHESRTKREDEDDYWKGHHHTEHRQ